MYIFTKEQKAFKSMLNQFIQVYKKDNKIEDFAGVEIQQKFINDLFMNGYFSALIQDKSCNLGVNVMFAIIMIHELAKVNASIAHIASIYIFGVGYLISEFGTEKQKSLFVSVEEDFKLGAMGYNEVNGNGPGHMETSYEVVEGGFILNGHKSMISNALNSNFALIYAKDSKSTLKNELFSIFIIDLKKNTTLSRPERTIGMRSLQLSSIKIDNLFIKDEYLLGREGDGLQMLLSGMGLMRVANLAISLGCADAVLDKTIEQIKKRKINSQPMGSFQHIRFQVAEMKSKISYAHLNIFYLANLAKEDYHSMSINSLYSKIIIPKSMSEVCDIGLQLFGGSAFLESTQVASIYQDSRVMSIIGGSTEALKNALGTNMLLSKE